MTMGEYIKKLRSGYNIYGRKWSQEELGLSLNPPVNRAAVNKWETGQVENLKRTHIQQLAKMFGVLPSELMCFDDNITSENITKRIQYLFGEDAYLLLQQFNLLDERERKKVLGYTADLVELQKYTRSNKKEHHI